MAKEFFKNLPSQETPFNASRWNGLLNGEEAMGSIVVDDITCKNILPNNIQSQTINGLTVTRNNDGSLTLNGTATANIYLDIYNDAQGITLKGDYRFYLFGNSTTTNLQGTINGSNTIYIKFVDTVESVVVNYSTDTILTRIFTFITKGTNFDNVTLKYMITKGTNEESYAEHKEYDNSKIIKNEKTSSKIDTYSCTYINDLIFKPLRDVTDMNNIKTSGIFTLNATTNVPAGTAYYNVAVFYYDTNPNYAYMIATKLDDPNIYVRYKFETWKEWKKIVPTAI